MRHPLRNAAYGITLALLGVGGLVLGSRAFGELGEPARTIVLAVSAPVAVLSTVVSLMALFAAVGRVRLRSGKGVIARWHVGAAECDRFRAFDAARSAQDPRLLNEVTFRKPTPAEGVDVIVGRRQIMVDGSYHPLSGIPAVYGVQWFAAPVDPECLEFALIYPRGRFGGARLLSLRVPVPASARDEGVRVYRHYHARTPKPGQGLVFRRPALVFGWCIAVTLATAAIGAAASVSCWSSRDADLACGVAMASVATAIGTVFVILMLALIVWKSQPPRPVDS